MVRSTVQVYKDILGAGGPEVQGLVEPLIKRLTIPYCVFPHLYGFGTKGLLIASNKKGGPCSSSLQCSFQEVSMCYGCRKTSNKIFVKAPMPDLASFLLLSLFFFKSHVPFFVFTKH